MPFDQRGELTQKQRAQIHEMLAAGVPQTQIAKAVGCHRNTVRREIEKLRVANTVDAIAPVEVVRKGSVRSPEQTREMAKASERVSIDVAAQLTFIVDEARALIERLKAEAREMDPRRAEVIFQGLDSVRAATAEWVRVMELLHSAEEAREFQQVILTAIDEEAPEFAARIRAALERRRAVWLAARGAR